MEPLGWRWRSGIRAGESKSEIFSETKASEQVAAEARQQGMEHRGSR